jgi:hypothetical protein
LVVSGVKLLSTFTTTCCFHFSHQAHFPSLCHDTILQLVRMNQDSRFCGVSKLPAQGIHCGCVLWSGDIGFSWLLMASLVIGCYWFVFRYQAVNELPRRSPSSVTQMTLPNRSAKTSFPLWPPVFCYVLPHDSFLNTNSAYLSSYTSHNESCAYSSAYSSAHVSSPSESP